jgi:hypothetical protein
MVEAQDADAAEKIQIILPSLGFGRPSIRIAAVARRPLWPLVLWVRRSMRNALHCIRFLTHHVLNMPHRIHVAHIVQIENDFNDPPRSWYVAFCFFFSADDAPPPLATQLV